jgi:protein SCO1
MLSRFIRLAIVCAAALSMNSVSLAHEGHGAKPSKSADRTMPDKGEQERARNYFTDTVLTNFDGRKMKFYSDIMAGKTVVVNFMFTSCTEACPLINYTLQQIQARLGDRMGKDIVFVSVSVDPEKDTPAVLTEYRKTYQAGKGWLFLTGDKASIEIVSQRMGQVFERDAHLTALLVGNTRNGQWRKIPPHLPPPNIAAQIRDIADAGAH